MKKIILFAVAILFLAPVIGFAAVKYDAKLVARLKGQILLQADGKGEAWYVNPKDGKRYYMKDGETAFAMLRKFGLGVKTSDLEKIPVGDINASVVSNQAVPAQQTTKAKEWKTVISINTQDNKQSETFRLEGGQQKLVYSTAGNYVICSIYILEENDTLEESGGFPVVMVTEERSGDTLMRKSAGNYYLDIKATKDCNIEVQELR